MKKQINTTVESTKEQKSVLLTAAVVEQLKKSMDQLNVLRPQVQALQGVIDTIVLTAVSQAGYTAKDLKDINFKEEESALTFSV